MSRSFLRIAFSHPAVLVIQAVLAFHAGISSASTFENRSSAPRDFVTCMDILYFTADDGIHGRELWRSDGTEDGTWMVLDAVDGSLDGSPEWLAATVDRVFFALTDPVNQQRKLWVSDGTPKGTRLVTAPPFDISKLLSPPFSNGKMAFCVTEKPGYSQLIRTDGTEEGTTVIEGEHGDLTRFNAGQAHADYFHHARGITYFLLHSSELYMLPDGADKAKEWGTNAYTRFIGAAGDEFLVTFKSEYGREPMVLTEHMPGRVVRDIYPGEAPSLIVGWEQYASTGELAFFTATDGTQGTELWRSDGSEEGTFMLADIYPGEQTGNAGILTPGEHLVYFVANDGTHGHEPWVTDGTAEGTRLLEDVNPGPRGSDPYRLYTVGDTLYFSALDERTGEELWRSDGTPEGTALVRDIVPGAGSSEPYHKGAAGGLLFFSATDNLHGYELWATDGTAEGTRMVKDIAPVHGENPSSFPARLHALGDLLLYTARTGDAGTELWRSDGTQEGTCQVADLFPGPASANPDYLCALGKVLLFTAETPNEGIELWRTAGTAQSTVLVKDIVEGPASGSPSGITAVNETHAIFAANDGVNGVELWITDGTESGTKLLCNINPDPGAPAPPNSARPRNFTRVGSQVYFSADDGEHGVELWVTDGTPQGTRIVKDAIPRIVVGD